MTCPQHPKYQAKSVPRTIKDCYCWTMWAEKRVDELMSQAVEHGVCTPILTNRNRLMTDDQYHDDLYDERHRGYDQGRMDEAGVW